LTGWLQRLFVPPIPTSLTVDKLSPAEIDEMLWSEQRAVVWKALRDRLGLRGSRIAPEFVEALRLHCLNGNGGLPASLVDAAESLGLSNDRLLDAIEQLRRDYRLNTRSASPAQGSRWRNRS
jgi:hypothetical protein